MVLLCSLGKIKNNIDYGKINIYNSYVNDMIILIIEDNKRVKICMY